MRDARRHHQRFHAHRRDGDAGIFGVLAVDVGAHLLETWNLLSMASIRVSHLTLPMPYPARHDKTQRKAVLRQKRLAVHRPDEKHVLVHCLLGRKAAGIVVLDVAVEAAIGAEECDVDHTGLEASRCRTCRSGVPVHSRFRPHHAPKACFANAACSVRDRCRHTPS